jgi:hypothetical protein
VDVSFSQARRFTGLGQQGSEAGSLSRSHSLITENCDKSFNCLKITFFKTNLSQISMNVLKKTNDLSVRSEECVFLKVAHLLKAVLFG